MDSSLEAQLLDAAAKGDLAEVERAVAEGCMHTRASSLCMSAGCCVACAPLQGRNKTMSGSKALMAATLGGHADVVTRLIEHGAKVNAVNRRGEPPLAIAISRGYEDIAKALLAHGASVDANDREWSTPLLKAVEKCNSNMVELLLNAGADADIANMHNRTARQAARDQGMTLRPLAATRNDSPLATELLTAAAAGDVAEIERLVTEGAPINCRNPRGSTPLIVATLAGQTAAVTKLLQLKTNVHAASKRGATALACAASLAHEAIAAELIAHSAALDSIDREWTTPLHRALAKRHTGIVRMLTAAGANLDLADKVGRTALLLLAAGARADAANQQSCLQVVVSADHMEAAKLLLDAGAAGYRAYCSQASLPQRTCHSERVICPRLATAAAAATAATVAATTATTVTTAATAVAATVARLLLLLL
eukprot:18669-Heterococcus_DN1.PRE.1